MEKRKVPDLSNATPSFLIDEIGKIRDQNKENKFYEGIYRKALDARLAKDQLIVEGDAFIGNFSTSVTERLDLDAVRSILTPEQLKQCTAASDIVTLRIAKKEVPGAV